MRDASESSHTFQPPPPPAWARALTTVGVTGTNGKTTTTTWLAAALSTIGPNVICATTVGAWIGAREVSVQKSFPGFLELMKQGLNAGARFAAVEVTSEALARGFARGWPFSVGVFTNLTHDHLDAHHMSAEHYLASKAQLFLSLPTGGTAVLNVADPSASLLREIVPEGVRVLTYASPSRGEVHASTANVTIAAIEPSWNGTRAELRCAGEISLPPAIFCRGIGAIYTENAVAALLGGVAAGADPLQAADAIAKADPPPGRFEVVCEAPRVVVDYAHSPDALLRTVQTARALANAGTLTVIFGAGGKRDKTKRAPMGNAARAADKIVLTSDNPRDEDPRVICDAIAEGLAGHANVTIEIDRARAIAETIAASSERDVVLICGKGHEKEQIGNDGARPFSDADVARAAARSRAQK